jgi:iron-sulfur cluster assembly accessory protein
MTHPITVTDRAAARIREIVAATPQGVGLRLAVNGGGCSGFQYEFSVAGNTADDDIVLEHEGARVIVDSTSQPFVAGSVLDFVDDLIGQSFKVRNPNATASCGCGTSFSV